MSKSKVSDTFAQFEARTSHKLEDARKAEKQSRGNPLPVGYVGTGVISDASANVSKGGDPYASVEVKIVNDPDFEGKSCTGAFGMFRDTQNRTTAEAYAAFMDDLEDMGLSRPTRETGDIATCFDELLSTPHYVSVSVTANTYSRDGKQVKCYAVGAPDGSGRGPTAESSPQEEAVVDDEFKDKPRCSYLSKPHYVIADNEDGTYDIMSVATKRLRKDIAADDIEFA